MRRAVTGVRRPSGRARGDGLIVPCGFDGFINGERAHARQHLASAFKPGDDVAMDNLGDGKAAVTRRQCRDYQSRGCQALMLAALRRTSIRWDKPSPIKLWMRKAQKRIAGVCRSIGRPGATSSTRECSDSSAIPDLLASKCEPLAPLQPPAGRRHASHSQVERDIEHRSNLYSYISPPREHWV